MSLVTDTSPHKIGKYTPLSRIKIEHDDVLEHLGPINVITTSWNIEKIIRPKLEKINPRINFLSPYSKSERT